MIYLDNAATTWPKPPEVTQAMLDAVAVNGANPGRGGHQMALEAGRIIYRTRELLAHLFNINDPSRIIFTYNATDSLNMALYGSLAPGDHVITSRAEHNAVYRPLKLLESKGVEVTYVPCSPEGLIKLEELKNSVRSNTKLIVMTHASNVLGTVQPIEEIGRFAKEKGLIFLVDAAQTAGVLDIDVEKMNIDLLAFPGHKSLYGPQGTGGLYIRPGYEITPFRAGGTGGNSESPYLPEILPDRYESGTPNTPGIAGLGAGVSFILATGIDKIRCHEQKLTGQFLAGLRDIEQVKLYGLGKEDQAPVVSLNLGEEGSAEIAHILDKAFGIAVRAGLHCAPLAHQTMQTLDQGAVRFSFSYFNTEAEIEYTLDCIKKIVQEL